MESTDFLAWYSKRRTRLTGHPLTDATVASMRSRIGTAYKTSNARGNVEFAQGLGDEAVANGLLDTLDERMSTGALRLVYEACKAYHAYALAQGWEVGVFAMERPAKNPRKAIRVYSADEVDRLIGAARGISLHWFAFLAVFAHTGRRVNEVLGLKWEHLRLDAEQPHFDLPTTKNKRQAYVPLDRFLIERVFTSETVARMKEGGRFKVRDAEEFVFPWAQEKQVRRMLERHCARVDVPYLGFHCFRHTFVTGLLARGVPMHAVSKLVGHSQTSTTDRVYNHTTALTFAGYLEPDDGPTAAGSCAPETPERLEDGRPALRLVAS